MTFLTAEDAAKELHMTEDTVRRMAAEGKLPARKVGRRWLFHPELLDKYMRNEWQSTKEQPGVPGGLDSLYAVRLFDEAPKPSTERKQKNSRQRSASATGDRRN